MLSWLRSLAKPAVRRMQVGVDVSAYQGRPDTWRAEAGTISWAAVKLTELEPNGTRYVNEFAAADWSWLRQNNKSRIAYLFGHPSVSAADSVDFFLAELSRLGLENDDGVALDLEDTDGLRPEQVSAWAQAVMADLVRRLGRQPVLYTFLSFAQAGNCAGLGSYPLWIADPSSRAGHPRVPPPWRKWVIHQYDISGPIDRDLANYRSQSAMTDALGKQEVPDVKDLGGKIVAAVTSVRWPDGTIVVAGLGEDGYVQATRYADGRWEAWQNVSKGKALGAPALLAWGAAEGHLYYTADGGTVVELETGNSGRTWA